MNLRDFVTDTTAKRFWCKVDQTRINIYAILPYAVPVHPYSAGKYYVEQRIDKICD